MFELQKRSVRYVCLGVWRQVAARPDRQEEQCFAQMLVRHNSPRCHCRRSTRRRRTKRSKRNPSPVLRETVWLSSVCAPPVDLLVKQAQIVLSPFLFDWILQLVHLHLPPNTYFLFLFLFQYLLLLVFVTDTLIVAIWGGHRAVHRPQLVETDKNEIWSVLERHCGKNDTFTTPMTRSWLQMDRGMLPIPDYLLPHTHEDSFLPPFWTGLQVPVPPQGAVRCQVDPAPAAVHLQPLLHQELHGTQFQIFTR